MLTDYRSEKWNNVFTQVLLKTLRSAFLSASVADFIGCSLEALSAKIRMEQSDRIIILENLWKVFQKVPPMAQSQIVPELRSNWENNLNTFNTKLTFDLDKLSKLFDCAVIFEKLQIRPDDAVQLNLFIRSFSDVPLKIREFAIVLSDASTSYRLVGQFWTEFDAIKECDIELNKRIIDADFMVHPEKVYKIKIAAKQNQFFENTELHVRKHYIGILERIFIFLYIATDKSLRNDYGNK